MKSSQIKVIRDIAFVITNALKEKCLVIQQYESYSTNSVYIKLDYGVLNSIRISDHKGKKHLKYKYNLIIGGIDNIIEDKFIRYYFGENSVYALINQVLFDRQFKIRKYGMGGYISFMKKNKQEKGNTEGFWKHATIIHDNSNSAEHIEAESGIRAMTEWQLYSGQISLDDLDDKYPWN